MAPFNGLLELALFAGAGGGILGGHALGFRCIGAVEIEPFPRSVLLARQDDGTIPPFPVWDDIRSFTVRNPLCRPFLRSLRRVSSRLVVSGGFPCQDISCAGKGEGIDGERSGLWSELFRVVCELRPRFVFVENSPMLTVRGLGRVLGDLASVGYDAEWQVLGADDVGAPHRRKRIWILAHANTPGGQGMWIESGCGNEGTGAGCGSQRVSVLSSDGCDGQEPYLADPDCQRGCSGSPWIEDAGDAGQSPGCPGRPDWWDVEPDLGRVAHGVASGLDPHGASSVGNVGRVAQGVRDRVGRLKAIGNGQVPACAAEAFRTFYGRFLHPNNPGRGNAG